MALIYEEQVCTSQLKNPTQGATQNGALVITSTIQGTQNLGEICSATGTVGKLERP